MDFKDVEKEIKNQFSFNYTRSNFDKFLLSNKISFNFKAVHVTGTNGKGSTCKYIYEIIKKSGYKVGIFTSPYFYNLRETIVVNDQEISENDFCSIYLKYRDSILKYKLTEFEIQTFIAFVYFQNNNLDLAIVECGMGGALDATNIFIPILSIITSVSVEHTYYLGKSVTDIALHKTGIFKESVPALVGALDEEGMVVVKQTSKNLKCPLIIAKQNLEFTRNNNQILFNYDSLKNIVLNTCASYQIKNASVAIEASFILRKYFKISDDNIKDGLNTKPYDFRFEWNKGSNVILDGAHNVEAITNLIEELKIFKKPIHIIFASFKDKNIEIILPMLNKISEDINLTYFPHPRCRNKDDYFLHLEDFPFYDDVQKCYDEITSNFPGEFILFTGSLAFCGYVKRNIKL